jgi:hypothetical protein
MQKTRIDPATLLIAAAGALLLLLLPATYLWLTSIGGLAVLLTLYAFDSEGYRSVMQSLAFAAVAAIALAITALSLLPFAGGSSSWLPLIWAGGTLLFWVIDQIRMSSRQNAAARQYERAAAVEQSTSFSPPPPPEPAPPPQVAPVQRRAAEPVLVRPETAPPQRSPAPVVRSEPIERAVEPPIPPSPLSPPPNVVLEPVREAPLAAEPYEESVPEPEPVAASPFRGPVAPSRPGKETMIYVSLIGEGLNVLRSVQAEHLGKDYYRILEAMPEGETWEFTPGQVVKVKKKNLSSGKGLVAVEEAPRAQ